MSAQPVPPPLDGSVSVLPGLVDFNEQQNPDLPWAILAPESGTDVVSISFAEYAKATHRVARLLRPDGSSANGEVIAVLAHCDSLLYLALLVGLVRAGYVPFPISPKNSVPAIIHMFDKVACGRIISQSSFQQVLASVEAHFDEKGRYLHVIDLPGLDQVFPVIGRPSPAVELFVPSVQRTFSPEDPLFYLHSSGSTGFPKPIPLRQVQALQWCRSPVLFDAREHRVRWGSMPLPTYHTIGIYMQLFAPIMSGYPVSLYKPQYPAAPPVPTPLNVIRAARITGATGIAIVPAFLESWAHSEESVEFLKTLDILVYAGGPLSPAIGDQLVNAGVKLYSVYGGTEFGVHTKIFDMDDSQGADADVKTSKDWEWVRFPDWMTCRWDPQGDGQFELQCLTRPEHRPSVENLADVTGYATHDLLIPHPAKNGLWKLVGRKDDVIVLSIGMNVIPIPQEGMINSSPMVNGAVMFGRGHTQCGILIEPCADHGINVEDEAALVEFRNKIWPVVEEANRIAPTFARLFKEMIIVTDPSKPLPRAAKGTVIRHESIKLYAEEIDKLYKTVQDSADAKGIAPPPTWSSGDILQWLLQHTISLKGDASFSTSKSVFEQGFDSLYATYLRNRIVGALRASPDGGVQQASFAISQNFIFEHPTLDELAHALAGMVLGLTQT